MDEELKRRLQIAFMDCLPIDIRHNHIIVETSIAEIQRKYQVNKTYQQEAEDVIQWLNKSVNNHIIWYGDKNYPCFSPVARRLPYFLLYKGTILGNNSKSVSIVGTRHVDNEGFQASFKLGLEASINNISVVSGLADGCDQASLNGAVAGGFPCYGIIGCGLEIDYPSFSDSLKKQMLECGGGIISRFAPNFPPFKQNFPNRNLIIAAMGNSTIVVQAPKKSGSLITCDMALQLGKDVYVSKAGIGVQWSRIGSNQLYYDGCETIDSLSECYPCMLKAEVCQESTGIRFGNKHYFIKSCI